VLVICSGLVLGITPLLAAAQGNANQSLMRSLTHQGWWLAGLVSLFGTVLIWMLPNLMLGQSPEVVAEARVYLQVMAGGFLPALTFAMLKSVVTIVSSPQIVTLTVLLGMVVNCIGNYVLGFGHFGAPCLGLQGLAISSIFSYWLMLIIIMLHLLWSLPKWGLVTWQMPLNISIFRQIIQMGWPLSVAYGLEIGLFTTISYLMGSFGAVALAAHQVVFQTTVITFMVPLGMSLATTIRVGHFFGRKDWLGARRSARISVSLSILYMTGTTSMMLLFPHSITGLYLDITDPRNTAAIELATQLLRVAAIMQIGDGIQTTVAGALRGLQDTRTPMLLGFGAFWCCGLFVAYLLGFYLRWGAVGLWIGQCFGVQVAAISYYWRWRRSINAV
jgi:multidrug resistance protein, MATE family